MRLWLLAAAAAVMSSAIPAAAGTLIVSGDTTSTFSLSAFPGFGGNPGNRAFYANLLGGAKQVLISDRVFGVPGFPSFANQNLSIFYGSIDGVSVSRTSDAISADVLRDVGMLILQFPNTAFNTSEATAIGAFVRGGGTLYVAGEASTISPIIPAPTPAPGAVSNAIVNDLLAGIGSNIRLGNDTIGCCGTLTAQGSAIADTSLTRGVDTFNYGAVSSVTGGTAQIYAPVSFDGPLLPFVASEMLGMTAVPEPATWTMMILGFGAVGGMLRRRRCAAGHMPAKG